MVIHSSRRQVLMLILLFSISGLNMPILVFCNPGHLPKQGAARSLVVGCSVLGYSVGGLLMSVWFLTECGRGAYMCYFKTSSK